MKLKNNYFQSTRKKELLDKFDYLLSNHQYILILGLIFLASIFYSYLYIDRFDYIIDENNHLVFSKIPFGHGPLIHNLVFDNSYQGEFVNRAFVTQKMPVLPLLIYFLSFFSHNFYFIIIVKNLLFFSILVFFIKKFIISKNYKNNRLYLFFIIFLIPYNMFVCLNFEFADSLISILLPCLYLILVSDDEKKYLLAGLLLFFLYLTKNSLLIVCVLVPILIIIFEKKKEYQFQKYLLIFFSISSMFCWGVFTYVKTSTFAIGSNSSSVNSMGMNIALHPEFLDYFPDKSLDLIHNKIVIPKNLKTEWDIHDYFTKKNKEYLSDTKNLYKYIFTFPEKLKFIFFYIKRDAANPNNKGEFDNSIRYSSIVNKLILNFSILIFLFIFFKKIFNGNFNLKNELIFVIIFGSYLMPLIIGWATSKHLVPLVVISYFYIVVEILKKKLIL